MSIDFLRTLSLNPFIMGKIIQHFLSGYNSPVDLQIVFYVLPIILYEDSRKKLLKANMRSRFETLFGKKEAFTDDNSCKLSGKAKLSGFLERYIELKKVTKQTLIVLSNEDKIIIDEGEIKLIQKENYQNYSDRQKEIFRAAYYLGIVISKTSITNIKNFLGVE